MSMGQYRCLDRPAATNAIGPPAEALALFILFSLAVRLHEITILSPVQARLGGYNFNAHVLMVLMPVAMVLATRPRPAPELRSWFAARRDGLRVSASATLMLALVWASTSLLPALGEGKQVAFVLPPYPFPPERAVRGFATTVIFSTIFCGFGEEIFFRAYLQGLFNRGLGRPWRMAGVRFGPGLLIASALFGIGHGMAFWNPIADGRLAMNFLWTDAIVTAAQGMIFGLLYERDGSILAPSVLHASIGLFFGSIVFVG